jgi:hypothetical protein
MKLWEVDGTSLRAILEAGDTIESDPNDVPFPRRLVLGYDQRGPVHVAVSDDAAALRWIVITVYRPNLEQWLPGFRQRRRP